MELMVTLWINFLSNLQTKEEMIMEDQLQIDADLL